MQRINASKLETTDLALLAVTDGVQLVVRRLFPATVDGRRAVRTKKQKMLRAVGSRSFTRLLGRLLGGDDPETLRLWQRLACDDGDLQAALELVRKHELPGVESSEVARINVWLENLINPTQAPIGLALLRAVAQELYAHAGETGLHMCWGW